jgi:hypothetical protein
MQSSVEIKELRNVINSIGDIVDSAILENQMSFAETQELRLRQAEKTLGYVSSIRHLTSQYPPTKDRVVRDESIVELTERSILWSGPKLWHRELAKSTTEVWIITRDLKPDSSDGTTGRLVRKNIKSGKRYLYFYPEKMPAADGEIARLLANVGLQQNEITKVGFIPLPAASFQEHRWNANIVLYFENQNRAIPPRAYQEVVLSKVPQRGAFWQEHPEEFGKEIRDVLLPLMISDGR